MKKDNTSKLLLQRYLTAREEGIEPYFDADEIDELLDSFEESDDYTYYGELIALGAKFHPLSNDNWNLRQSKLHIYCEEYEEALGLAESINESNNQELDMIRLECYLRLDQFSKAMKYIDDLEEYNCDYLIDIYEFVAPLLVELGMNEDAYHFINRGLSLSPDSFILKEELCFNLEIDGQYGKAIQLCNELIDQEPYSYDLWFTLGRLYSLTAKYEKAIEAFDFALTCDESDMELKILKAYCLFMNESYRKAIEVYMEIAVDEEAVDRIKPLMAECYIKLEEFEEAYQLLKDIINRNEKDLEAVTYINFIRCCVETDREQEASHMLRNAANLFRENVRILSLLALSYLDKGNEEMALAITNKIFEQLNVLQKEDKDLINTKFMSKPERYIPIKDLAKEYLNNKGNSN